MFNFYGMRQELNQVVAGFDHAGIVEINVLDAQGFTMEIVFVNRTSMVVADEYTTPRTFGSTHAGATVRGQSVEDFIDTVMVAAEAAVIGMEVVVPENEVLLVA